MTPMPKPDPPCRRSPGTSVTQKMRLAEDALNSRDPEHVSLAYTPHSRWRNRAEFLSGREAIVEFLRRKWSKELDLPPDQGTLGLPRNPDRRGFGIMGLAPRG